MARHEHLTIYRKFYVFTKEIYSLVINFPKSYKYSLGEEIQNKCWKILDLIIEINSLEEKSSKISDLSLEFDKLKLRLRFAHEIKIISNKRFISLQKNISEIGDMIGGWLNWAWKNCWF